MDEMLRKEDVLKALSEKIDGLEKRDAKADVILGLATAMSVVKLMEGEPAEKEEPCTDAISRQAVLEAIEDDNRNAHYSCFASNNDAQCFKQIIRELPPVNPAEKISSLEKPNKWNKSEARRWKRRYLDLKQRIFKLEEQTRWIPVSERLPEQGQKVLVTTKRDNVAKITWNQWFQTQTQYPKTEIIAWMSLPEPYKASPTGAEGSEEND